MMFQTFQNNGCWSSWVRFEMVQTLKCVVCLILFVGWGFCLLGFSCGSLMPCSLWVCHLHCKGFLRISAALVANLLSFPLQCGCVIQLEIKAQQKLREGSIQKETGFYITLSSRNCSTLIAFFISIYDSWSLDFHYVNLAQEKKFKSTGTETSDHAG